MASLQAKAAGGCGIRISTFNRYTGVSITEGVVMKRLSLVALLFASSQLFAQSFCDRDNMVKTVTENAKLLGQVTLVPEQAVKCRVALTGLSGSTLTAAKLIDHRFDSQAKTILKKNIAALTKVEGFKCKGEYLISKAKIDLIGIHSKL